MIALALMMCVIVSIMGLSSVQLTNSIFSSLNANQVALQAQQYAESKAELIKNTDYKNLIAQTKKTIPGTNFFDEVIIGAETDVPGQTNIKQKIVNIKIYQNNESLPRINLAVPRTTAGAISGIPTGSIIPWYGNIANIPSGFALCDGTNGTPNLMDKFIVGAGTNYKLGDIGGDNIVKLTGTQIGNHYHGVGDYYQGNNNGAFIGLNHNVTFQLPPGGGTIGWNGSNHGGYFSGATTLTGEQITSLAVATAAQEGHENRPPYYALYYLMKL